MKTPKIHLADSGFASHLCGVGRPAQLEQSNRYGALLETFVVNELRKMAGWSKLDVTLHHYRTEGGREVDVVIEDRMGRIVGVEVKAAAAVNYDDAAGLRDLKEAVGKKWVRGVVLHSGPHATAMAPDMHALPMGVLWQW